MFYILEEIVEHIMLFLNIPDRPFLTALVKGVLTGFTFFVTVRIARFAMYSITSKYFVNDIKLSLVAGCIIFFLSLLVSFVDRNK